MVFNNGTSAFFQLLNQGNAGISINRNRSERSSGILAKLAAHEVMDTSCTTHGMEKKIEKVDAISKSLAGVGAPCCTIQILYATF